MVECFKLFEQNKINLTSLLQLVGDMKECSLYIKDLGSQNKTDIFIADHHRKKVKQMRAYSQKVNSFAVTLQNAK